LAHELDQAGEHTVVLNGGDGQHSHPSQGLLDLYTLAHHFDPHRPQPEALQGKRIGIVGDVLHSRVARSNLWALSACGADVVLCGPPSLVPDAFADFLDAPPPGQTVDPVLQRGRLQISRNLDECLSGADAVMTLRLQQERMTDHLLTNLDRYHRDYGLSHERLRRCSFSGPVLHPGPVNRGVEMSGALLDDRSICLVEDQVRNRIPIRMALLYLMAAFDPVADSPRAPVSS
jgi:aspartate carbamoyltransferase catalytic subunit